MPAVPAFCNTCGAVFASGFNFENAIGVSFAGCGAGPCPRCGGTGHIPDGVFNFIGNTIEILSAPGRTIAELTRLAEILKDAKAKAETREEVASRIKKEVPTLSKLGELLPENRGELYGFLAVVLAAIQLFTQSPSGPSTTIVNVTQVIQQVTESPKTAARQQKKKVGRNEPCPCGSGVKFKRCCGAMK